jgi:hypothetical protein
MVLTEENPLNKVESEARLLEKIMLLVPGFKGYKEKEMRREADKLVRDKFGRMLEKNRDDLQDIYSVLIRNRLEEAAEALDKIIIKLDGVVPKVEHASYGYSGFFDAIKITEEDLDRMLRFDIQLLDDSKNLSDLVKAFKDEVQNEKFENVLTRGDELSKLLDRLEETFEKRVDVIRGLEVE